MNEAQGGDMNYLSFLKLGLSESEVNHEMMGGVGNVPGTFSVLYFKPACAYSVCVVV